MFCSYMVCGTKQTAGTVPYTFTNLGLWSVRSHRPPRRWRLRLPATAAAAAADKDDYDGY